MRSIQDVCSCSAQERWSTVIRDVCARSACQGISGNTSQGMCMLALPMCIAQVLGGLHHSQIQPGRPAVARLQWRKIEKPCTMGAEAKGAASSVQLQWAALKRQEVLRMNSMVVVDMSHAVEGSGRG